MLLEQELRRFVELTQEVGGRPGGVPTYAVFCEAASADTLTYAVYDCPQPATESGDIQ